MSEMNCSEMTVEELEALREQILVQCSHWESCKDGSYEAALYYAGYQSVIAEIKKRKENKHA